MFHKGTAPTPPSVASSAMASKRAVLSRRLAEKRHQLCLHYVSSNGCPLGTLCPNRHATGASDETSNAHHSTFSKPICTFSDTQQRMHWFWCELACNTKAHINTIGWQQFSADWTRDLEALYLQRDGAEGIVKEVRNVYSVDFTRMIMFTSVDGGSRRAIQRVEMRPTPMWVLEPLASGSNKSKQLPNPIVVDAVAATELEFFYCNGGRNLFAIEISGMKMRVNLLLMNALTVPERLSSVAWGTLTNAEVPAKWKGAARQAVVASQFRKPYGETGDTAFGDDNDAATPVKGNVAPTLPQGKASPIIRGPSAPSSLEGNEKVTIEGDEHEEETYVAFRLHRQPVTVEAACPPSRPYDTNSGELDRFLVAAQRGTMSPIFILDSSTQSCRSRAPIGLLPVAPVVLDLDAMRGETIPNINCEMGVGCAWQSAHHIWSAHHWCTFVKSSQCFLCEERGEGKPIPTSSMTFTEQVMEERSALHQLLFSHDVTPSHSEASVLHLMQSKHDQLMAVWRRHQHISRWFRTEWESVPVPPSQRPDATHRVVLHNVAADGDEFVQLMNVLNNKSIAPRRRTTVAGGGGSGGHTPLASNVDPLGATQSRLGQTLGASVAGRLSVVMSPKPQGSELEIRSRIRERLSRSAGGQHTGGDAFASSVASASSNSTAQSESTIDPARSPSLHFQRVQHHHFFQRFLRCRNELFLEWQAYEKDEADRSSEEVLFRFIPRSKLHSILHEPHSGAAVIEWQQMYFYRDMESALSEPVESDSDPPPEILLIAVGYAGATIRGRSDDIGRIITPPLMVPWDVNAADHKGARRFQPYHSLVMDAAAVNNLTSQQLNSESPRTCAKSPGASTSAIVLQVPNSVSPGPSASPSLSAAAKVVWFFDPTQWCPMYLVSL